jgi:hypothetical protein
MVLSFVDVHELAHGPGMVGVTSQYHLLTRQFNSRTPAAEADTLCWYQGAQVWVVPAMQSKTAEQSLEPV